MATGAAVVRGRDVGLASVGGDPIAIVEARVANARSADTGDTSRSGVGERADAAAGAAVRGVGAHIDLAAIGGEPVAVAEARVAGAETAHSAGARGGGIGKLAGALAAGAVDRAVAVVIETVADFDRGGPWRAGLRDAVDACLDGARTCPSPASGLTEVDPLVLATSRRVAGVAGTDVVVVAAHRGVLAGKGRRVAAIGRAAVGVVARVVEDPADSLGIGDRRVGRGRETNH